MPGKVKKIKDGKYRLWVFCGYDGNGRQIRYTKVISATSDRDANRQLALFYAMKSKEPLPAVKKITFKRFVEDWRIRYAPSLSPTTAQSYESALKNRLIPEFGDMLLSKISESDVSRYFAELSRFPDRLDTKGGQLSKGSIFNLFKMFRALMGIAQKYHYISYNPVAMVPKEERPKKAYSVRKIFGERELKAFLHALNKLDDRATNIKNKLITRLMLLDGFRRGEVFGLKISAFNMERMTVSITTSAYQAKGGMGIKAPKTASSNRELYIDNGIKELLLKHLDYERRWLKSTGVKNDAGYLFIQHRNMKDKRQAAISNSSSYYHWLQSFLSKNGLPSITVHALRHMAASYSLSHGASLTDVKELMGHSSIQTTNIYLHSIDESKKKRTETMSRILDELGEE